MMRFSLHEISQALALRSPLVLMLFFFSMMGAALIMGVAGPMPADYALTLGVMPGAVLLAATILHFRDSRDDVIIMTKRRFWVSLVSGLVWGLTASLVYDLYKPLVILILGLQFDPYRAMPHFGHAMTGLPPSSYGSLLAGWFYHYWIGMMLGMIFALMRPQGGIPWAILFVLVLQAVRLAVYPNVLRLSLEDPEFIANGIVGLALWGGILGFGIKRWGTSHA
ncbi:hypothetical protein [Desulfovibrio inopinatus]|uniref:hypothetical protein n=1 Tax=Desulfovibrio inopinatus TaxID=102109 RepID=UPI000484B45A|nr:hypothetical protein [Desulfovibrio inopinatus]